MDDRASKKIVALLFSAAFFFLIGWRANTADAASLYIAPAAGEYSVGQSFTLTVGVASPDKAANAVSGTISFPPDILEATAVSKSGSILNLWVEEPILAANRASFEGIALNPGFTGKAGKVMTITFKAKAAGTATVALSYGKILANDGAGTDITAGLGRASFVVKGASVEPNTPSAPVVTPPANAENGMLDTGGKPKAIEISSTSHPESDDWYDRDTGDFRWSLPRGASGVSVFVDRNPNTVPAAVSDGLFDSYSSSRLDDGVWYLHLRVKNSVGWGPASHFRFQIDTDVPSAFSIKFIDGNETFNAQPTAVFNTTDSLSGIDHYIVKVGDDNAVIVNESQVDSNPFILPPQQPGDHRLLVVAVDKAGNHVSASADFKINSLVKPVINQYPERLKAGQTLTVKGESEYPDTPVRIWIQGDDGPPAGVTVRSDQNGSFVYLVDGKMRSGIYKLWAQVRDENGGTSDLSDKITIVVEEIPIIEVGDRPISIWYVVVFFTLWIAAQLYFIWRGRRRKTDKCARTTKRVADIKDSLHHSFADLHNEFAEKLKIVEQSRASKRMTPLEKKLITGFRKQLSELEHEIEKWIDGIKP